MESSTYRWLRKWCGPDGSTITDFQPGLDRKSGNCVNALHSAKTRTKYIECLNAFVKHVCIGLNEMLQCESKQLQAIIIQYLVDLKEDRKLAVPASMKVRLAAVKTFLEINEDITYNKVKRYIY